VLTKHKKQEINASRLRSDRKEVMKKIHLKVKGMNKSTKKDIDELLEYIMQPKENQQDTAKSKKKKRTKKITAAQAPGEMPDEIQATNDAKA